MGMQRYHDLVGTLAGRDPALIPNLVRYYLGLYGIMVGTELLLCFIRNSMYAPGISTSVLKLHRSLLTSLFDSPLSHFDHQRTGDIIHLFSQQVISITSITTRLVMLFRLLHDS